MNARKIDNCPKLMHELPCVCPTGSSHSVHEKEDVHAKSSIKGTSSSSSCFDRAKVRYKYSPIISMEVQSCPAAPSALPHFSKPTTSLLKLRQPCEHMAACHAMQPMGKSIRGMEQQQWKIDEEPQGRRDPILFILIDFLINTLKANWTITTRGWVGR